MIIDNVRGRPRRFNANSVGVSFNVANVLVGAFLSLDRQSLFALNPLLLLGSTPEVRGIFCVRCSHRSVPSTASMHSPFY